jgi:HSP20 family protein
MNELNRWDPVNELRTWFDTSRRVLDTPFFRREVDPFATLAIDVFEENGDLVVKANVPGVSKGDVKVDVTNGVLHIAAETKQEKNVEEKDYYLREYSYGSTSRSVQLPNDVDAANAKAEFKDGVLRVRMPKTKDSLPHSVKVPIVSCRVATLVCAVLASRPNSCAVVGQPNRCPRRPGRRASSGAAHRRRPPLALAARGFRRRSA